MASGSGTTALGGGASYFDVAVFNALVPKENPKVVPIVCPFSIYAQVNVDFTLAVMAAHISVIQSIYADNYDSTVDLFIYCPDSQQRIVIPAGAQAYVPVFAPIRPKFQINSAGGVDLRLHFCNVPVPSVIIPK